MEIATAHLLYIKLLTHLSVIHFAYTQMGYNSKTMKKYVPRSIFFIATTLTLVCAAFFSHKVDAAPGVFYFNNAVDTSPATLGNYWQDSGHTVPAVGLPDLVLMKLRCLLELPLRATVFFVGVQLTTAQ